MPKVTSPPAPPSTPRKRSLAEEELLGGRLARWIRRETGDRVRGLQIEFVEDRVVVFGLCASYFCKQLVQQAALQLMRKDQALCGDQLDNQIEVG